MWSIWSCCVKNKGNECKNGGNIKNKRKRYGEIDGINKE